MSDSYRYRPEFQSRRQETNRYQTRTWPQLASSSSSRIPDEREVNMEGRQLRLLTNAYSFNAIKSDKYIHQYQIIITTPDGKSSGSLELLLSRNFVSRSIRGLIMEEIVPQLLNTKFRKGSVVIDYNLGAIYSAKRFKNAQVDSSPEDVYKFENLLVKTDLLNRLYVNILIAYSRSFPLDSSRWVLITSILHHQLFLDMLRYGSVYFSTAERVSQNSRLDLLSQHIMGISISGLRRSNDEQALVVINCSHSYITGAYRLIDLLATFITEKPIEDQSSAHEDFLPIIASIQGTEEWFKSFCSILNGFKCQVEYSGTRDLLRFCLTDEPASTLVVQDITGCSTVQKYFNSIGVRLRYPNLPCLISKSQDRYYPLELCSLLADQKVPIFRLSTNARCHLAFLNKPKPHMYKQASTEAREKIEEVNKAQFKTFGVELSKEPVEASGTTLKKPTLHYRNQSIEPQRDYWESGVFFNSIHLDRNWCVVNTVEVNLDQENRFFYEFSQFCRRFDFLIDKPYYIQRLKQDILDQPNSINQIIEEGLQATNGSIKLILFVIDSSSTNLNRLVHLSFDDHPNLTATCLRLDSIKNMKQHRSIFRTLVHKLNARLGGTNVAYHSGTISDLSAKVEDLMIIGLDVTHPDNELIGVSIVGCAYTYSSDWFKHKSLVWPQTARVEIIGKMDLLTERLLLDYSNENKGKFPKHMLVYRDGVSHEEFERVRTTELSKMSEALNRLSTKNKQPKPNVSYIIAQKRHSLRFFQLSSSNYISNPPSGTLIDQDIVCQNGREFYLYSNTGPQATARPLHYHVLVNGIGISDLQKLTFFLCFNFGKCSGTLSMPSSLRYAHNAAYDARNRVIAAKEFSENRFYSSKFFC